MKTEILSLRQKTVYQKSGLHRWCLPKWVASRFDLFMANEFELLFYKDLVPNDEGISFGQLMMLAR